MCIALPTSLRTVALAVAISVLLAHGARGASDEQAAQHRARLRRPIALHLTADGRFLLAANQRSGSISVIDLKEKAVIFEFDVGERLSALVPMPGETPSHGASRLAVLDEARHELIIVEFVPPLPGEPASDALRVMSRTPVASYPVDVAVSADGRSLFVSSLWSRRLTCLEVSGAQHVQSVKTLDWPFAPRKLLLVDGGARLIVADAFGGRLAVFDTAARDVLFVREFPAHNIRGLGISKSGEMLLVSHQMLNELAHTVQNDVHWGLLMSNDLRWIPLHNLLRGDADLYQGAHMHPLGEAGNATSDPSGLAVSSTGVVAVALSGVGQIAIGKETDFSLSRLRVGHRPTQALFSADGGTLYTANTFGDSVSVVDLAKREQVGEISLGPQPELTAVDRGELLFYDGYLSHDGWMSCHSCHTDGHTNGQLNDNFSDGSFGAPKRVLSLLASAPTAPFAWDGGANDLKTQIRKSLSQTMQIEQPPQEQVIVDLAAFVESLPPPPSLNVARGDADADAIERGRALFAELNCSKCHAPPLYTTPATYDVGIHDKQGNKRFNPPSLIGVGQRGPYFHDSRAEDLVDVFQEHGHQIEGGLSDGQLADLTAFLRSL